MKKPKKRSPSFREIYEASPVIQRNLATACASFVLIVFFAVLGIIVTLLEMKGIL